VEDLDSSKTHTGWVKDLHYDTSNDILHSIGCNCIESWKKKMPTEKDEAPLFSHWKKSTIESSPTDGSTLSSDLLCLSGTRHVSNENGSKMDLLLAGGVDGRIHVWNSKEMGGNQPQSSLAAHDGRVNCLCFLDASQNILLSGSHDGLLKCWSMKHVPHHVHDIDDEQKHDMKNEAFTLELANQVNVGETRITAIASCCSKNDDNDDMKHRRFAFGTHNGLIYTATVVKMNDSSTSAKENSAELSIADKIELPGSPMINALCCISHPDVNDDCFTSTTLVIGHSLGLATVEFK
jgi:WD40 repeat protein